MDGRPKRVSRPGIREGYDRWSETYDRASNPVVALDRRYAMALLRPLAGERVLDAGCGTGANLSSIARAGGRPVGVDLSHGMLRVARRSNPRVPLAQADMNRGLPFAPRAFHALLCSLVSEHLTALRTFFAHAFAVLAPGGRLVFSAFHPELAAAGVEANFEEDGVEYRLGAELHTVDDYLGHLADAGFEGIRSAERRGDAELAGAVPGAGRYLDTPLLLTIEAIRPARDRVR